MRLSDKITVVAALLFAALLPSLQGWPPGADSGWPHTAPAAPGGGSISVTNAWKHDQTSGETNAVTVAPTTGDTLIVVIGGYGFGGTASTQTVSDNINGTSHWTYVNGNDNSTHDSIWYLPSAYVTSSITTITLDAGSSNICYVGIVHDVAGLSSSPFTGGETASNTSNGETNPITNSLTNGTANAIYFAVGASPSSALTINQTGSSPATWSLFSSNSAETNGSSYIGISVPNLIVSSSASRAQGWTCATSNTVTLIAAFH